MKIANLLGSISLFAVTCTALSEPVAVKHSQGAARGFLVIKSEEGKLIATGELTQLARGNNVTSR